jgi:flagellar hook-associated protein 1 FlgK
MSDLFSSLSATARALESQRYGLDVVGQNIANVNTPGWVRRTVDLQAVAPTTPRDTGGGVSVAGVRALRAQYLDRRLTQERPAEQRQQALAEALALAQTAFGTMGASIDGRMGAFFNSMGRLADDPTSSTARDEVLIEAQALAGAFSDVAARLQTTQRETDQRVRSTAEQVNVAIADVARLNEALLRATGTQRLLYEDQQAEAIRTLSGLVDINVIPRSDGAFDVAMSGGRALVTGADAHTLGVTNGPGGMATLLCDGADVTTAITGGALGGYLEARDVQVPDYLARLDELAFTFTQNVNALHDDGYDLLGRPGGAFFTSLAQVGGAASAVSISATMKDASGVVDPTRIAAAGIQAEGDNQVARSIAGLRTARVLQGGTATLDDGWSQLVYRVGRDVRSAEDEQATRAAAIQQVEALRDSVSGVSLDEEAVAMLKYQRAYEANAKMFTTINDLLGTLLAMVNGMA